MKNKYLMIIETVMLLGSQHGLGQRNLIVVRYFKNIKSSPSRIVLVFNHKLGY